MKCPLRSSRGHEVPCMYHDCAWWYAAFERCAILELAQKTGDIAAKLIDIEDVAMSVDTHMENTPKATLALEEHLRRIVDILVKIHGQQPWRDMREVK